MNLLRLNLLLIPKLTSMETPYITVKVLLVQKPKLSALLPVGPGQLRPISPERFQKDARCVEASIIEEIINNKTRTKGGV